MKKKIISILFITIIILGFTGCSKDDKNEGKAKVVNNENKTEQLSSQELYDINKENAAKFKKYYVGAKISFDGTVASIEEETRNCHDSTNFETWQNGLNTFVSTSGSSDRRKCYEINFDEGYKLVIPEGSLIDIADVNRGDKYHVESNIVYIWGNLVECFGVTDGKSVDFDLSNIKKIS